MHALTTSITMRLAAAALMACLGLGAAGCASTGVRVTDDQLAGLHKGETTVDQAVAALGAPTTRMQMPDGRVSLHYVYAESKVHAATFIPIVGAFAGGSDTKSSLAILQFGPDGKLLSVTTSQSQHTTSLGQTASP